MACSPVTPEAKPAFEQLLHAFLGQDAQQASLPFGALLSEARTAKDFQPGPRRPAGLAALDFELVSHLDEVSCEPSKRPLPEDLADQSTTAGSPNLPCLELDSSDDEWECEPPPPPRRALVVDTSTPEEEAQERRSVVNRALLQGRAPRDSQRLKAFSAKWKGVADGLEFPAPLDKDTVLRDIAEVKRQPTVLDEFTGCMFGRHGMYRK